MAATFHTELADRSVTLGNCREPSETTSLKLFISITHALCVLVCTILLKARSITESMFPRYFVVFVLRSKAFIFHLRLLFLSCARGFVPFPWQLQKPVLSARRQMIKGRPCANCLSPSRSNFGCALLCQSVNLSL